MTTEFKPRFVQGKAMQFAGLRKHMTDQTMKDVPAQWQTLMTQVGNIPHVMGKIAYGLIFDAPEDIDYMPAVEVSQTGKLPAGFTHAEVPAWRYAVFPYEGHVMAMRTTIDAIWRKWLPQSGYKAVDAGDKAYFFERYGEKFDPQTGTGDIEIWIPIEA